MLKIEKTEVAGWENAIRGMRNSFEPWEKSDSFCGDVCHKCPDSQHCAYYFSEMGTGIPWRNRSKGDFHYIGPNDLELMKRLRNAGTDYWKFMRMIVVYADITAPLYFWKQFGQYKIGTVTNSCSTMHKLTDKEFRLEDFSCEHMYQETYDLFRLTIDHLNKLSDIYLNGGVLRAGEAPAWFEPKDKEIWWNMIQLLPSSYNQKRMVMMNYEVLAHIWNDRRTHNLNEWAEHKDVNIVSGEKVIRTIPDQCQGFCDWIKTLPYSELITGDGE